jgi:hypothetical protein
MKLIARGWQYSVYDLGNGRVRKCFHSYLGAAFIMTIDIAVDSFRHRRHLFREIPSILSEMRKLAEHSFRGISEHPEIDKTIFGNPMFLPHEYDYEQDKVRTFKVHFSNQRSRDDKRRLLSDLVRFCIQLYTYGAVEKGFNIGGNFGVDMDGKIMIIDLGELVFDPDIIQRQISGRVWRDAGTTDFIEDDETRDYYFEELEKNFSIVTNQALKKL